MSNESRRERAAQHEQDALVAPEENVLGAFLGESYPTDAIGGGVEPKPAKDA